MNTETNDLPNKNAAYQARHRAERKSKGQKTLTFPVDTAVAERFAGMKGRYQATNQGEILSGLLKERDEFEAHLLEAHRKCRELEAQLEDVRSKGLLSRWLRRS